jgi:hypothetical protein
LNDKDFIDENGITWKISGGSNSPISQSRDEPNDDRWKCLRCGAINVSDVCKKGFRCKRCNTKWTNQEMLDECDKILRAIGIK